MHQRVLPTLKVNLSPRVTVPIGCKKGADFRFIKSDLNKLKKKLISRLHTLLIGNQQHQKRYLFQSRELFSDDSHKMKKSRKSFRHFRFTRCAGGRRPGKHTYVRITRFTVFGKNEQKKFCIFRIGLHSICRFQNSYTLFAVSTIRCIQSGWYDVW